MRLAIQLIVVVTLMSSLCCGQNSQEGSSAKEANDRVDGVEWLKQFQGQWTTSSAVGNGIMNCKMLGDVWVVNEYRADFQGINYTALQTLGFDNKTKRFTGSWVDSTSNYQWKYTGKVDDSGKKLMLEAKGPDMTDPSKLSDYRDVYEIKTENKIIASSQIKTDGGKWSTFMTSEMKRKADSNSSPKATK